MSYLGKHYKLSFLNDNSETTSAAKRESNPSSSRLNQTQMDAVYISKIKSIPKEKDIYSMDDSTKRLSHQTSSSQATTQSMSSVTSNLLTGQLQGPRASLPTLYHQTTYREPQTEEEKQAVFLKCKIILVFLADENSLPCHADY